MSPFSWEPKTNGLPPLPVEPADPGSFWLVCGHPKLNPELTDASTAGAKLFGTWREEKSNPLRWELKALSADWACLSGLKSGTYHKYILLTFWE